MSRCQPRNGKLIRRTRSDDFYYDPDILPLPSMDVFVPEYQEEDYLEEIGLLGPDGRPIVRKYVIPKRRPAGFILIEDQDDE